MYFFSTPVTPPYPLPLLFCLFPLPNHSHDNSNSCNCNCDTLPKCPQCLLLLFLLLLHASSNRWPGIFIWPCLPRTPFLSPFFYTTLSVCFACSLASCCTLSEFIATLIKFTANKKCIEVLPWHPQTAPSPLSLYLYLPLILATAYPLQSEQLDSLIDCFESSDLILFRETQTYR